MENKMALYRHKQTGFVVDAEVVYGSVWLRNYDNVCYSCTEEEFGRLFEKVLSYMEPCHMVEELFHLFTVFLSSVEDVAVGKGKDSTIPLKLFEEFKKSEAWLDTVGRMTAAPRPLVTCSGK
jgi:hypothetical protein